MSNLLSVPDKNQMLEALKRSGYLFESEISKYLVDEGFFVESNISVLDPITGKGREIDLVAEYNHPYSADRYNDKAVAIARFVFELKNTDEPVVLLTKFDNSPNSEIYTALKVAATIPKKFEFLYYPGFYESLFDGKDLRFFTQYCSFTRKKNEDLMAYHPENLYSSLVKLTYYCEDIVDSWNSSLPQDDYLRNFLYLPIFVIKDNLYELEIDQHNNPILQQVDCSSLVFNYHYKDRPETAIVYFVTQRGLKQLLQTIIEAERNVEKELRSLRKSQQRTDGFSEADA